MPKICPTEKYTRTKTSIDTQKEGKRVNFWRERESYRDTERVRERKKEIERYRERLLCQRYFPLEKYTRTKTKTNTRKTEKRLKKKDRD